jgi:integrase
MVPGKPLKTLKNDELDAINGEFLMGRITENRAHMMVRELADRLKPKKPISWLPENEALAEAYLDAKIRPKRSNVAPKEADRRVLWAVKQLGAIPILTSKEEDLYKALSHLKPRSKVRAAGAINAIMRWKGLAKAIQVERAPGHEPQYLTYDELMSFSLAKKEWQLCVYAAFATGCRYAELFAISTFKLREEDSHAYINEQVKVLDKDAKPVEPYLAPTKNRKTGTTVVIAKLREFVRQWAEVSQETKLEMRKKGQPGKAFAEITRKALGRKLNFHKLRHSYARCMLTRNEEQWTNLEYATLTDLRFYLRDQQDTIERHYAPWVVSDAQMKANRRRFG